MGKQRLLLQAGSCSPRSDLVGHGGWRYVGLGLRGDNLEQKAVACSWCNGMFSAHWFQLAAMYMEELGEARPDYPMLRMSASATTRMCIVVQVVMQHERLCRKPNLTKTDHVGGASLPQSAASIPNCRVVSTSGAKMV
jgi:hypothetical protein